MPITKIYFLCPKFLYKNDIFNLKSDNNRDNALYPYHLLKQRFLEKNIDLNTYDYFKKTETNYALLFQDIPRKIHQIIKKHLYVKKFLIIYESPIKNERNQEIKYHRYFEKIFTWNTGLVDNKKYFRLSYSQKIPETIDFNLSKKNKLCVGIFSHKLQSHPKELYSERIKAIRWFEKNHPSDFDLYGEGWDRHYFKDKFFHLNRLKFLAKLLRPNFPSWRGSAKNKKEIYDSYKFALCYENAQFPDYITEKIFDCFFGGCVPIYLGAPNITDYIPENTFIDKRNFKNYEELYDYIKSMPDKKYLSYLDAIKNFIQSDKIYPFSAKCFSDTLVQEITNSLY